MGQYHLIVNLDKREFLHPHHLGDGLKLVEFGCSSQGTMTALALLLCDSNGRGGGDFHQEKAKKLEEKYIGRWNGDRIVITGDYADPMDKLYPNFFKGVADLPGATNPDYFSEENPRGVATLYGFTNTEHMTDVSPDMAKLMIRGNVFFSASGKHDGHKRLSLYGEMYDEKGEMTDKHPIRRDAREREESVTS